MINHKMQLAKITGGSKETSFQANFFLTMLRRRRKLMKAKKRNLCNNFFVVIAQISFSSQHCLKEICLNAEVVYKAFLSSVFTRLSFADYKITLK